LFRFNVIALIGPTVLQLSGEKETRNVRFIIRAEIWLKRYIEGRQDTDSALIVTERLPHRMSIAQMRYVLKRISARAAINKEIYPH
jgi:integrase/recombinase XerD